MESARRFLKIGNDGEIGCEVVFAGETHIPRYELLYFIIKNCI